jgi:uncharacterized membrane protein YukC
MDNQILTFILDTVKSIDSKVDNLVTKEECNNKQNNCTFKSKNEWNIKKITAIGVIITGILAIIYKV